MANFQSEKAYVMKYFKAMEKANTTSLTKVQASYIADDYEFYGVYPFNKINNLKEVSANVWQPLYHSFKNIQRRQDVFIAGSNDVSGDTWVMSMGHFMGLFDSDWCICYIY